MKLFLLPFSGASKYSYVEYLKLAPDSLDIRPIEIPGRGARAGEDSLTNIHHIVEDILGQIRWELDEPYAIYGHSMGGILSYLLTHRIIEEGLPQPHMLFLTGCVGPSVKYRGLVDHLLPRDEFIQKIRELGGSPDAILNDEGLMEFFLPILRADFQAVAEFQYEHKTPFDINVTILIGSEEEASVEEANTWQTETLRPIELEVLSGNHFFIFDHAAEIVRMLTDKVEAKLLVP